MCDLSVRMATTYDYLKLLRVHTQDPEQTRTLLQPASRNGTYGHTRKGLWLQL